MKTYEKNAKLFKAFCDPNRLLIIDRLRSGRQSAAELLEVLHIGQPTLSHHMKIMVEARLLTERREGKRTYYAICRQTWDEFMLVLDAISNESYWAGVDMTSGV